MIRSVISFIVLLVITNSSSQAQQTVSPVDSTLSVFFNINAIKNDTVRNSLVKALTYFSKELGLSKIHTVQKDESINLIIKREYGLQSEKFANTYNKIAALIRDINELKDNTILPSQAIKIPAAPTADTKKREEAIIESIDRQLKNSVLILSDSFFMANKKVAVPAETKGDAKVFAYNNLSLDDYKKMINYFSERVKNEINNGAVLVKVGRGKIKIGYSDSSQKTAEPIPVSPVDTERIDLSNIPAACFDTLVLIDYFNRKNEPCPHGRKVFLVIQNILHNYKLDNLIGHIKIVPVNFYENKEFAGKLLDKFYNDEAFDREEYNLMKKDVKGLIAEMERDTTTGIENPDYIPEVYLNALLKYYYNTSPDVISTSIWASTINDPCPNFYLNSKTNMVTAGSDYIGSYVEQIANRINPEGGMQEGLQPIRTFFDKKKYGCLIVGCETKPGNYYGMASQDGLGMSVIGKGCYWAACEECLEPSDLGTSFSTPEISAKLFIAKAAWRAMGYKAEKELTPEEASKMLVLSSQINEPFVGKFASAGRILLKKLLHPTGAYLVDTAGNIKTIDSLVICEIPYKDEVTGHKKVFLLDQKSKFSGLYILNNKLYIIDDDFRQRWYQVDPISFCLTYYIDGKCFQAQKPEDFARTFNQLIITKN